MSRSDFECENSDLAFVFNSQFASPFELHMILVHSPTNDVFVYSDSQHNEMLFNYIDEGPIKMCIQLLPFIKQNNIFMSN